ncbi:ComF family protein [Pseudomonas aeruginosa]|uniref:ComF family protein n=1 Tax=Pseudomonas aeruginosa TaxID=287 RepID=UPI00104B7145|nr:double zinc ribbon domain-containing protein [Pseudomonas aeruginosa]
MSFPLRPLTRWLLPPPACLLCAARSDQPPRPLCRACAADLPWSRQQCRRCALPLPLDGQVCGLHLALVDDVLTTGATTEHLSRLLRRAGAARVDVYCLARTPKPG